MYTFIYANVVSGGAQTLIMRVGGMLKSRGFESQIVCKDISPNMQQQFAQNHISINKSDKWTAEQLASGVKENDTIFTFFLSDFLRCESYVSKRKIKCKVFLYVLHPSLLRIEGLKRIKWGRAIARNYIRKAVYQYINNGNIFFMDEMCIEWTEQFYHKKIKNPSSKIFRIPIDDINWDKEKFNLKLAQRKETCQILTIARADFPFKGYMQGLIKDFSALQKKYPNIYLRIISYGSGIDQLKAWLMDARHSGTENIELIGETRYDMLEEYYWQAHFYVGMGTTLLDAAKYGVVSINALLDTYQFKSTGFFHDFPQLATAEKENCKSARKLLEAAILLDEEEYEKNSRLTRELFCKYYSMDIFMNKLLQYKLLQDKHFIPIAVKMGIQLLELINR